MRSKSNHFKVAIQFIQVSRKVMQWEVGGIQIARKKSYGEAWFNVISITRGG